jgi:hypothetical protein
MGREMIHSTKLRIIVRLRRSRLEVLWFDKPVLSGVEGLTTPRKIEGRRIEG